MREQAASIQQNSDVYRRSFALPALPEPQALGVQRDPPLQESPKSGTSPALRTSARGPSFDGFLAQAVVTQRDVRRRRQTCGISLGVHGLVLLGALSFAAPKPVPSPSPRVAVSVGLRLPLAPTLASTAATRPARTPVAKRKPELRTPAVVPQRAVVAPPETIPPAADEAASHDAEAGAGSGAATTVSASGGGQPVVGAQAPAPALPAAQIKALLDRYLLHILRSRIESRLSYPAEAERMGVEGTVLVRVRIDGAGKLMSAALMGTCPHEVLCEAALQTVRESSPFPAPPSELGAAIEVSVPLTYRLQ